MDVRANSIKAELPRFTEHGEHEKNDPLSAAEIKARPLSRIERWLLHQAREGRGLRVLDFGCGKGAFVASLRTEGF